MEFVINDTLENGNGEKVKVFLLAGQSNASGVSHTSELKKNISEDKFLEYEAGYNNVFINYYNDNVVDFNKLVVSFPARIVAVLFRYKRKDFHNNEKREMYQILNEK